MHTVHTLDSGLRPGSENLAIDRAYLASHARGTRPDLLRFYRSRPCASVGRYQAIDRELRTDYCTRNNIEMLRRLTGGGALYTDAQQLGFSLILGDASTCKRTLEAWLRLACEAVARALMQFGLDAQYAFPNDVEIAGRKIASVFATFEADSILLHGTVLFDADIKSMLEALRAPTEKLSPDGLSAARDRLATLVEFGVAPDIASIQPNVRAALAEVFCFDPVDAEPEVIDRLRLRHIPEYVHIDAFQIDWSNTHDDFIEAVWQTAGGLLRCRASCDAQISKLRRIEFAASVQSAQPYLLDELHQVLAGLPLARLTVETKRFFLHRHIAMPGVSSRDFMHLIGLLLDKISTRHSLGLTIDQANALMVHSPGNHSTREILRRASVVLVPYCAKPDWCTLRHANGCSECGLCTVGEAYRLARERGMRITTITRYEHLVDTLDEMKQDKVAAYIGMCCSQFFIKRQRAFREADIPALLMDISGANCYELKQEHDAYAGTFSAQATLDENLLHKVMQHIPAGEPS